jgi:SAM-dependent methyltransferase
MTQLAFPPGMPPSPPGDMVGRWSRHEVDRPVLFPNVLFGKFIGQLCTPLHVSASIAQAEGVVRILEAGCGTGHGVYTWQQQTLLRAPGAVVTAMGINDEDFSRESAWPETRRAIAAGQIEYRARPIGDMGVAPGSFDIVLAHEVLQHCRRPDKEVESLLDAVAPGRHLFFNLGTDSREHRGSADQEPFKRLMRRLRAGGHTVQHKDARGRHYTGKSMTRAYYYITKPG